MQNTSGITNYSALIAGNYTVETKVSINGVDYGEDVLISVETTGSLFKDDLPVIGSCVSGEIDIRMLMPSASIPRMATIKPYIRLSNIAGTVKSGWLQKGEYFIDTRSVTNNDDGINILKIHGYDAMLKAEATYPDDNETYPKSDAYVVNLIATTMGIQIDSRTTALMDESYQIVHPAFASMRQVLMNIAGMYAGNFIISPEGKLLLVQLGSVGDGTGTPDHQIGKNSSQMTVAPAFDGFSKVIIRTGEYDSDGNEIIYESGNTTGRTLECEIGWGSQTVADNILSIISGWSYQPYEASGVVINPALELGDSISINGIYSGIYTDTIKFAQLFTADTKAPYDEEIDHEYAYEDPREKKYIRRMEEVKAEMSILAGTITAKVDKTKTGETFGWTVTDSQWNVFNENGPILTVNANGAYVKGEIQANSGLIGGFNIGSDAIYHTINEYGSKKSNTGVYVGTDGLQLGKKFLVDPYGNVSASALTVTGGSLSIGDDGNGSPMFQVTSAGYVTAKNLSIQGGSISIGGNFMVDANGNLSATSGTFSGNVYAGNIKYESTTPGAGTVSGDALSLGTVTAGLSGSIPTGQLSLGACLSLGYADLFNSATEEGTNTYPQNFTAAKINAYTAFYSGSYNVQEQGEVVYDLTAHYHNITVDSSGNVQLGTPQKNKPAPFNIADTKVYKDAVSAATVASRAILYCNATNYNDFDYDCNYTSLSSGYLYEANNVQYGRIEIRNSSGTALKVLRIQIPASSSGSATVSITGAQAASATNHGVITATATLGDGSTVSNTYDIYLNATANTESAVTMQVIHGTGSSQVVLAERSVTPTAAYNAGVTSAAVTSGSVLTTTAATYGQYDSGFNFGLSGNLYTSGSYQYGRIAIKNAAGTTLKTIRVVIPASSSGSVTSITVARKTGDQDDWSYDSGEIYAGVILTALSGTTTLYSMESRVRVTDLATAAQKAYEPDHASALDTDSSNYGTYDTSLNMGLSGKTYVSGTQRYGRVGVYNVSGTLLKTIRVYMPTGTASVDSLTTGQFSSGYYVSSDGLVTLRQLKYIGSQWYVMIQAKSGNTVVYEDQVDIDDIVDEAYRLGGGGGTPSSYYYWSEEKTGPYGSKQRDCYFVINGSIAHTAKVIWSSGNPSFQ